MSPAGCATSAAAYLASALLLGCHAFDADLLGRQPGEPRPPKGGIAGNSDSDGDVTTRGSASPGDAGAVTDAAGGASADDQRDAATRPTDAGGPSDAAAEDAGAQGDASAQLDAGTDAGPCAPSSVTDYCSELPALDDPPVIDGVLDCGPPLLDVTLAGWNGTGVPPPEHTTQLAVAHRPDGLYVYVEVRGQAPSPHPSAAPIYCGDAIELYLDADGVLPGDGSYDVPGTIQLIVAAPASAAAPNPHAERFVQGASQGAWAGGAYQLRWLADGYALEALIVAADLDLPSWAPAGTLGLDLVIDVAGPAASPDLGCGLQLGQYFLRLSTATPSSCDGEPWCDTRAFCVADLS